jgi:hypothetical protein
MEKKMVEVSDELGSWMIGVFGKDREIGQYKKGELRSLILSRMNPEQSKEFFRLEEEIKNKNLNNG